MLYLEPLECPARPNYTPELILDFRNNYNFKRPLVSVFASATNFIHLQRTFQRLHPQSEYFLNHDLFAWTVGKAEVNGKFPRPYPKDQRPIQLYKSHPYYIVAVFKLDGSLENIFTPLQAVADGAPHYAGLMDKILTLNDFKYVKENAAASSMALNWCLWFIHIRLLKPAAFSMSYIIKTVLTQYSPPQYVMLMEGFCDKLVFNMHLELKYHTVTHTTNEFENDTTIMSVCMQEPTLVAAPNVVLLGYWRERNGGLIKDIHLYTARPMVPHQPFDPTYLSTQLKVCHGAAGPCPVLPPLDGNVEAILFRNRRSLFNYWPFERISLQFLLGYHKDCIIVDLTLAVSFTIGKTDFQLGKRDDVGKTYLNNFPWGILLAKVASSTCTAKIVTLYMSLMSRNNDKEPYINGHANILLFNKNRNIIEHYEPHGMGYNNVDNWALYDYLEAEFKIHLNTYTYTRPNAICPNGHYGYQAIVGHENTTKTLKGTCTMWALYFINDRLQHPDQSAAEVYLNTYKQLKVAIQHRSLNSVIRDFIITLAQLLQIHLVPTECLIHLAQLKAFCIENTVPNADEILKKISFTPYHKHGYGIFNMIQVKVILEKQETMVVTHFDVDHQPTLTPTEKEQLLYIFLSNVTNSMIQNCRITPPKP